MNCAIYKLLAPCILAGCTASKPVENMLGSVWLHKSTCSGKTADLSTSDTNKLLNGWTCFLYERSSNRHEAHCSMSGIGVSVIGTCEHGRAHNASTVALMGNDGDQCVVSLSCRKVGF
jgi:hypothetical protein